MKIKVSAFGFPGLAKFLEKEKNEVDISGNTIKDVIKELLAKYGVTAQNELMADGGQLDPAVQILLNEQSWVRHFELENTLLQEGDNLTLLLPMAGG